MADYNKKNFERLMEKLNDGKLQIQSDLTKFEDLTPKRDFEGLREFNPSLALRQEFAVTPRCEQHDYKHTKSRCQALKNFMQNSIDEKKLKLNVGSSHDDLFCWLTIYKNPW